MAAQVVTPNYQLLNVKRPSELESAIKSGFQAYGAVSNIKRQNQLVQIKQAQEQRAQVASQQEEKVKSLQIYGAKSSILQNRLADLHQTPDDKKGEEYQRFLSDAKTLGIETKKFPTSYNDDIAEKANIAYGKSPRAAEDRQFSNKVALQHLTNAGQIAAAQQKGQTQLDIAKQKADIAAQAAPKIAMDKAEAASYTDELKKVNADANFSAQKTLPTANKALQLIKEYQSSGPIKGKIAWALPAGQKLALELNKLQLREFQKTHNVRSPREYDKIVSSVGTIDMYPSTLIKAMSDLRNSAGMDIDRQKFYNDSRKKGVMSSQIQINWNDHVKKEIQENNNPVQTINAQGQKSVKASDGKVYTAQDLDRIIAGGGK